MARPMFWATALLVVAGSAAATVGPFAFGQSPAESDGKREFTLTGCLLRSGYAGYQLEGVAVETIDGKAAPEALKTITTLKKWTLQGGGNLGPRVGERVLVVGRSEWRDEPAAAPADEPPSKGPTLEVKSLKTVAPSCSEPSR